MVKCASRIASHKALPDPRRVLPYLFWESNIHKCRYEQGLALRYCVKILHPVLQVITTASSRISQDDRSPFPPAPRDTPANLGAPFYHAAPSICANIEVRSQSGTLNNTRSLRGHTSVAPKLVA